MARTTRTIEADGSKAIGVCCCDAMFQTANEADRHEAKHNRIRAAATCLEQAARLLGGPDATKLRAMARQLQQAARTGRNEGQFWAQEEQQGR